MPWWVRDDFSSSDLSTLSGDYSGCESSVGGMVLCFLKGVFRFRGQDRVSKAVLVSKPRGLCL